MAWTINNGKLYFNTKLYTGNGGTQSITGVGFQPDWVWLKERSQTESHVLIDAVRGVLKRIRSNTTDAEDTVANSLTTFGTDGFSLGSAGEVNENSQTYASWNWLAAGTAPSNTYVVKVVSDSGNKYRFDDFGTSAVTLELSEGGTFTFDQSDSSNNGHPLRFATQANGANSSQYTTGVTTNGTPGQAGAYTRITVAASAPTLYYYCTNHSGMGGQANTPVTNSFSNFAGNIQSNISPNTTPGFSIVSYTGNGVDLSTTPQTVGHGLSGVSMVILKNLSQSMYWIVKQKDLSSNKVLYLNDTSAETTPTGSNQGHIGNLSSSGTTFQLVSNSSNVDQVNVNGNNYIAYCFEEKQGYSKFGSYVGNGNANGTFVYTGFRVSFVMCKRSSGTGNWQMFDSKREGYNVDNDGLQANLSNAEATDDDLDILSNGFKLRGSGNDLNGSGSTYIYMAFAENPFTSSAGTPVTAR